MRFVGKECSEASPSEEGAIFDCGVYAPKENAKRWIQSLRGSKDVGRYKGYLVSNAIHEIYIRPATAVAESYHFFK
jgi:hypothetical protein